MGGRVEKPQRGAIAPRGETKVAQGERPGRSLGVIGIPTTAHQGRHINLLSWGTKPIANLTAAAGLAESSEQFPEGEIVCHLAATCGQVPACHQGIDA